MTEYVYNLSYGKDSMAGLHVCIDILGWPVDRIVHAEVWATDTIPADLPPMVKFKAAADKFIRERWGLTVEHVFATRGGTCDPMQVSSTSGMSEESIPASCGGSPCAGVPGARIGSSGAFSKTGEKLTYEKLFYHVPERKGKNADKFGGGTTDSRFEQLPGATADSKREPCGFPYTIGSWCKKLKYGTYLGIPNHQRELVYQRTQTEGFLPAPGHEGQLEISCIT